MPGMSGPELQRALEDVAERVPIVFLTAHGDVPTVAEAMKRGAVDFLTKPVDREHLLEAIREATGRSKRALEDEKERSAIRERIDTLTPREREVLGFLRWALTHLNEKFALG